MTVLQGNQCVTGFLHFENLTEVYDGDFIECFFDNGLQLNTSAALNVSIKTEGGRDKNWLIFLTKDR